MKPDQIKIGKTYTNNGAGRSKRTVIGIGSEYNTWLGRGLAPSELGVLFRDQTERLLKLNLVSFARWAGKEVGP